MNFLPLCTAMVWPTISGTIVERRDHVFTTFFSLRVFRPSTFTRRWSSTNGPFLSERAIVSSLLLSSAQLNPLCAPHLAEAAHRAGHSVRMRTERTYKPRPLLARLLLDHNRPAGLTEAVRQRLRRDQRRFWCNL